MKFTILSRKLILNLLMIDWNFPSNYKTVIEFSVTCNCTWKKQYSCSTYTSIYCLDPCGIGETTILVCRATYTLLRMHATLTSKWERSVIFSKRLSICLEHFFFFWKIMFAYRVLFYHTRKFTRAITMA